MKPRVYDNEIGLPKLLAGTPGGGASPIYRGEMFISR
jgi:hypothetical protein